MEIFGETIDRELPDLARQGVRTRFIGRRDRVPAWLQERMAALEAETAANDRLSLWIAFDYGGRAELVDVTRRLIEAGVRAEDVDEGVLAAQLAYAELVFVETLWPDFGEDDLRGALADYATRRRRFGGR